MKATATKENETKMGVGSLVRYKEIIDKGDETSRFVITEDYGDGRVVVKELTQLTAFGYATYTRRKADFTLVQEQVTEEDIMEISIEMA